MANSPTETQKLLETIRQKRNLKKTGLYKFVADKTGAKERQVSRWYKGQSEEPQQRYFQIIKQLAEEVVITGTLEGTVKRIPLPLQPASSSNSEVLVAIARLEGVFSERFRQLEERMKAVEQNKPALEEAKKK